MRINAGEEERTAEDENGSAEERRKRAFEGSEVFECSSPEERPKKRSKSKGGESDNGAAMDDSFRRPFGLETTPRPRTLSLTSTVVFPGSIFELVRQTSVVPGLKNTEKAVWDAAQRDSIITSLPQKEQTKMIHAALSLGSEEGITELRRFVHNARTIGAQGNESLVGDIDRISRRPDLTIPPASDAMVSVNHGLAYFSALNAQLDVLEGNEMKSCIIKRVKLAEMAQYRECLVPEGAGKKIRAGNANLYLFRAIYPKHATIEKLDEEAPNSAANGDWARLRDRLRQGKLWLEMRDLYHRGAFPIGMS
jgi:hypothetical protein